MECMHTAALALVANSPAQNVYTIKDTVGQFVLTTTSGHIVTYCPETLRYTDELLRFVIARNAISNASTEAAQLAFLKHILQDSVKEELDVDGNRVFHCLPPPPTIDAIHDVVTILLGARQTLSLEAAMILSIRYGVPFFLTSPDECRTALGRPDLEYIPFDDCLYVFPDGSQPYHDDRYPAAWYYAAQFEPPVLKISAPVPAIAALPIPGREPVHRRITAADVLRKTIYSYETPPRFDSYTAYVSWLATQLNTEDPMKMPDYHGRCIQAARVLWMADLDDKHIRAFPGPYTVQGWPIPLGPLIKISRKRELSLSRHVLEVLEALGFTGGTYSSATLERRLRVKLFHTERIRRERLSATNFARVQMAARFARICHERGTVITHAAGSTTVTMPDTTVITWIYSPDDTYNTVAVAHRQNTDSYAAFLAAMIRAHEYTILEDGRLVEIRALPPPAIAPEHLLSSLATAVRVVLDNSPFLIPDADAVLSLAYGCSSFFLPFTSAHVPRTPWHVMPVAAHPFYYGLRSRVFFPTAPFAYIKSTM